MEHSWSDPASRTVRLDHRRAADSQPATDDLREHGRPGKQDPGAEAQSPRNDPSPWFRRRGVIRALDLPREIRENQPSAQAPIEAVRPAVPAGPPSETRLQAAERAALLRAIEELHGNMSRVAAELGVSRNTLYRMIKRHGIAPVRRA